MVIWLSLLVCVVGLLAYALSANPKIAEVGRLAFFAGLLSFLLESAPRLVGVVRG